MSLTRLCASSLIVLFLAFGFGAMSAAASEVTGTLSSDGSSSAGAPSSESAPANSEIAAAGADGPSNTLSGTVVQGVDGEQSRSDPLTTIAIWAIPTLLLVMLAFVLGRRKA